MSTLTPEERVERVRMALAEAGYPDTPVRMAAHPISGRLVPWLAGVPSNVYWRTYAICEPREIQRCWPCYSVGAARCTHDPLTSPWPEVAR